MSAQDSFSFTPKEWLTLQFAPLWVFVLVAGADGVLHRKELRVFTRALRKGVFSKDPLVHEVLWNLSRELDRVLGHFSEDSRHPDDGLREVADVISEKAEPRQLAAFAKALEGIGKKVAEASRPGPFRMGGKASPEEKTAIDGIRSYFSPPDPTDPA